MTHIIKAMPNSTIADNILTNGRYVESDNYPEMKRFVNRYDDTFKYFMIKDMHTINDVIALNESGSSLSSNDERTKQVIIIKTVNLVNVKTYQMGESITHLYIRDKIKIPAYAYVSYGMNYLIRIDI